MTTWTRAEPAADGWYWMRRDPGVVEVVRVEARRWLGVGGTTWRPFDPSDDWVGPIPEPVGELGR